MSTIFKTCSSCSKRWETREDFLGDAEVVSIGYQVNFRELELGLLLFNHQACKTTMAIEAREFRDLYEGPVFEKRKQDTAECPNLCLHSNNLRPCPAQCECGYIREICDRVARWPKK